MNSWVAFNTALVCASACDRSSVPTFCQGYGAMTKKVSKGVGAQEPAIIFMLGGGDAAKLVESSVCTRNIVSSQESERPRMVAPILKYRLVEVWNQRPGAPGLFDVVATGPQQHRSIPVLLCLVRH